MEKGAAYCLSGIYVPGMWQTDNDRQAGQSKIFWRLRGWARPHFQRVRRFAHEPPLGVSCGKVSMGRAFPPSTQGYSELPRDTIRKWFTSLVRGASPRLSKRL